MSPPLKPKSHCLSPSEIEGRLISAGVQPTAQRIAICRFVLCEADHPTAEQVKAWADQNFPRLSLATVYNTLHTLVGAGLLREYRFPHLEQVVYDNNLGAHHHFLDEATGRILDLAGDEVKVSTHLASRIQVEGVEVLVRGRIT
ncbi:MAG: transcriptional repressor [Bdellovibrionales bacterium]|nr:transcriptional repressor [Bdellovibrionales bacterium]